MSIISIRIKRVVLIFIFVVTAFIAFGQTKIDSLKTALNNTQTKEARLDVLDKLTTTLVRNNGDEQVQYLDQYLKLAQELKEYDLMASKSRFLIQYFIYDNQREKAKQLCDSLLKFKPYFKKESSEAHLLLKRAAILYNNEDLKSALKDYDKSAELFLKVQDSIFAADALFFGGQVASDANNFLEALRKYGEASKLYELLDDQEYAILSGAELTALYSKNGFIEKSVEERKRLKEKAIATKNYVSLGQLIGQDINAYYKLGESEDMLLSIDELLIVKDSLKEPFYKAYSELFALNYSLLKASESTNKEQARTLMDSLLKKTEDNRVSQYLQTDVLAAKAAYYELVNDETNLLKILETLSDIKTTNRLEAQVKAREKLAKIYRRNGQLNKAFDLNEMNAKVKDSIYNAQKTNTFLFYQAEFEAEKKQNELLQQDATIKQLKTEKELEVTKRNGLIAGIVSVFLVAIGFFYYRNRQKIKEQAYQNILLNNKIATKTEEINDLLTETVKHIKSKEKIAQNLQKVVEEDGALNIKSILADLRAQKADDAKLLLVKENIEKVNFDFIKRLSTQFPELSKTDIEICSFIKIGLDRNQIAELRNTSVEAVRKSRHRIRKKMNLDDQTDLKDYMDSI